MNFILFWVGNWGRYYVAKDRGDLLLLLFARGEGRGENKFSLLDHGQQDMRTNFTNLVAFCSHPCLNSVKIHKCGCFTPLD